MYLGEVSLLTDDVPRLAAFYKALLGVENGSDDPVHQTIIAQETMLTVYNDGLPKGDGRRMCLAFTVEDVYAEHARVKALGARAAAADSLAEGLQRARTLAGEDGVIVAAGSLYFAGELRTALGLGWR